MWCICSDTCDAAGCLPVTAWPRACRRPPMAPAVWAAMERVARAGGNPSSVHRLGQVARVEVDDAERHIATLVGMASASFAYAADPCEATSFALEQALRERTGPRGGRVRLWGCRSRWQPVLQSLLRTRGGQVACGPDGILWSAAAGAATEGGAVDVFAYDAWHPLSGEPIFLPEADLEGAHLHAVVGAFDLGHHGEPWPQGASRSADTVAVSSVAVGGPSGLCALIRRGAGAALPTTGSLPTALIAGFGVAAQQAQACAPSAREHLRQRSDAWRRARRAALGDNSCRAGAEGALASRLWWPGETIAKVVGRGDSEADVWPVVRADGSVSGAVGWLWAADGAARQDAQDAAIDRLLAQMSRA